MWSKYRVFVGIGVTIGAGMGIAGTFREVAHAQANPTSPYPQSPTWVRPTECPYKTWDSNWDKRASMKKPKGAGDGKDVQDESKASKAVRHLILIRHGQYNLPGKTDEEKYLTAKGREQAKGVGERLKAMNLPYSVVVNSTMTRAKETSDIIYQALDNKDLPRKSMRLLEEGAPCVPEPRSSNYKATEYHIFKDGARIEAAFRELFYRPDPSQKDDTYDIVVCHANVIRYFVCRALQFPPEAWLRFSLRHCSITWVTIRGNGNVSVRSIGDSGYFPPDLITTS